MYDLLSVSLFSATLRNSFYVKRSERKEIVTGTTFLVFDITCNWESNSVYQLGRRTL